jgi:D-proline reductase (dithiol) PrdB
VQSPLRWSDNPSWKLDYSNIDRLPAEEVRRRRAEFDRQKEIARTIRVEPAAA